jgi:hypothetical protein
MALICNDAILDAQNILNVESPQEMSYFARIAAGHVFEAAKFIAATSEWPEVVELLDTLDDDRRADWDSILSFWEKSGDCSLFPQVARARNYVFHYPDLGDRKGLGAVREALARLAETEATIALGKSLGSYRCHFADEVAISIISGVEPAREQEALEKFAEGLRDLVLALQRSSEAVLASFFASKGTFVPIGHPSGADDDSSTFA